MSRDIIDAIQIIAGTKKNDACKYVPCTVTAVDIPSRTCTCSPEGNNIEALFSNTLLMASVDDGILLVPAIGSTVLVAYSSSRFAPYIAMFSSITEVKYIINNTIIDVTDGLTQFNDGRFGGLVKVIELTEKINALENLVNDLITKYNTHTHNGVTTGSGVSGVTNLIESDNIDPITKQSDIENAIITHGV